MKVWEVGVISSDGYDIIEKGKLFLHESKGGEQEAEFKTQYYQDYYKVYCIQTEVNEEEVKK